MPKNQAYLEAEKKIAEALQSGATELDLSNKYDAPDEKKLTELPDSLWKLTHLTSLKLSQNKLTSLPDLLGQFTQLTDLNLSSNKLTSLPDSLGQLTQLTTLDLSSNKLTSLPDSLGQLTQLTTLDLSSNKLTSLPDSLGQLTQLTDLDLSYNQLTTLPDSLGQFTQLTELNLSNNQLTTVPISLGNLSNLHSLIIASNQLTEFPNCIRSLTNLKFLYIYDNRLATLPDWINQNQFLEILSIGKNLLTTLPETIGSLTRLKKLWLQYGNDGNPLEILPIYISKLDSLDTLGIADCKLSNLPNWIGDLKSLRVLFLTKNKLVDIPSSLTQLEHLSDLILDGNPLNPALQSAYDACERGKYEPLWAYLRSLEQNAEPLYEAKLVLVGEGNVGKTTLLKALKNEKGEGAPKKDERTTHGVAIDIHGLKLPHPEKEGVEIQLNAWDFGGQDVYRVTHQFFFSRRSLYLLVWEPRRGVQQGQVEDWLNMIRLRVGDEARVLIVSTHCKTGERIARIDKPVLQQQYGEMIVGFYEVDSLVPDEKTGEMVGIAELKKVIAAESAKLEQMGMLFNNNWKAARDELLDLPDPRIAFAPSSDGGTFSGICAARGLSGIDTETLAHLMHDLGYIVHYSDDEKLRDDVVLKPEWLTKAIGFVLEDRATQESDGILEDSRLFEVWHDHKFTNEPKYNQDIYPFFLRLMEKYDVSYRLMDGKASLVAQHVPQVRPELPWLPEQEPPADLRRIAMICAMEEDPPGLVPWMIVRTHDYAAQLSNNDGENHRLHWQKGMFLSHGQHGEAMLEQRGRNFYVYTQGQWPEYFMNIIQNTLEKLITDNWPGLKNRYRFMVPCPETIDGQPCKGRFNIHTLREILADGDTTIRCQECVKKQSITELLMGFEERAVDVQLREIKEHLAGMDSRIAHYFMSMMNAVADEAKNGPRLFTFRSRDAGLSPKQLFSRPLELQLWCEAEGCQHPVIEKGKGRYSIDQPHEWVTQIAPYANFVLDVLKTVAPIAAPAINTAFGSKTTEKWGIADHLSLASAIAGKLPTEIKSSNRGLEPGKMVSEAERSGMLALHNLLREVDPSQAKLGLHRVTTYTGDYRWLCTHHYEAWQPNIPDVIE